MEDKVKMSQKELKRAEYIMSAIDRRISQKTGAELAGISYRQFKRLIKKVRNHGLRSLAHKNRGKPSPRRLKENFVKRVTALCKDKYPDFGPTLAKEKLEELEGIELSKESLRQIMIKGNLYIPRRKRIQDLHQWRERKPSEGEMLQFDGSHHRWLESRLDQEFCLLAFIDDATNEVRARFYEYEGTLPALDLTSRLLISSGIPTSIYLDRHSTYKTNRQANIDEQLKAETAKTQFEAVIQKIGIKVIHARSPQAKGRIERLFKTLQDRLIKELRLANISTIDKANLFLEGYLPKFNLKFKVHPKQAISLFKTVPADFDYKWTFCIADSRVIARDYTISWQNNKYSVLNPYLSLKGQKVFIKQALDGSLQFTTKHKILEVKDITSLLPIKLSTPKARLTSDYVYPKSKKSWMDGFYIGNPNRAFANKYSSNTKKEVVLSS